MDKKTTRNTTRSLGRLMIVAGSALLLVGCSSTAAENRPRDPKAPPAPAARTKSRPNPVVRKLADCFAKVNKTFQKHPHLRSTLISACVGTIKPFNKAGCNSAWTALPYAAPDERARLVAVGCGPAYCPALPAPVPELCKNLKAARQGSVDPKDLKAFFTAVLAVDLGHDRNSAELGRLTESLIKGTEVLFVPPTSSTATGQKGGHGARKVITLSKNGELFLYGQKWQLGKLGVELKKAVAANPAAEVLLYIEKGLPYRQIVRVLDVARKAGIKRVGIIPKKPAGP